jgi:hypothetical protein
VEAIVYVTPAGVLVVDIGRGEHLFDLTDVDQRKTAMRLAEHIRADYPKVAQQILTILLDSSEAVA